MYFLLGPLYLIIFVSDRLLLQKYYAEIIISNNYTTATVLHDSQNVVKEFLDIQTTTNTCYEVC